MGHSAESNKFPLSTTFIYRAKQVGSAPVLMHKHAEGREITNIHKRGTQEGAITLGNKGPKYNILVVVDHILFIQKGNQNSPDPNRLFSFLQGKTITL